MLSLFSPTGPSTKIVVVQPRRLACQTAANRVAMEQGFVVGSKDCPIGYAIRFESRLSSTTMGRTVDFCTPGVLLRCAADDPDLSSVTHLVIDEIHERNADVDLLLALAKQVMQKRAQHATLQPLRLILMSATLDWSRWEAYFKLKDPSITVELVNLPDVRRFPITTVHLEEKGFPLDDKWAKRLQRVRHGNHREYDEVLCEATAELATKLFFRTGNDTDTDGSILCFVPGMEEIRRVQRHIDTLSRKFGAPNVLWLHSSLTLQEQAKVFKPGKKIILVSLAFVYVATHHTNYSQVLILFRFHLSISPPTLLKRVLLFLM